MDLEVHVKKLLIGAAAFVTAVTGALAGAAPAEARGGGWHGGWHGGGWDYRGSYHGGWGRHDYAGPALVAGLAGLAIGASLAQPRYYYGPAYGYADYYGPPPAYYVGPRYYGWYEGCRRQWVWIPRWRTYQLVRACY